MRRRVLCTVLAVLFIIGVLPAAAIADSEGRSQDTGEYYAQESDPPGGPEETEEQSGDTSDETDDSVCVLEESEDHSHDANCDTQEGEPICPLEESEGDTHSEDCYPQNDELISSPEEDEADDEGTEVNLLSITAGEGREITLQTAGSKAVVQFECTKSGLYSFSFIPKEDSGNWPYPDVQYSLYKGSNPLYQGQTNVYSPYGQWGYYLEEGTTYHLYLKNMGYDEEDWPSWFDPIPGSNAITVNLSVAYACLNFKVTNDGDMAADMVLIMNGCDSYAFTEELKKSFASPPSQDDQSPFQHGDRVALSLDPGKSVDITASVYGGYELSWMLLPKYSSGYSAEMSSGVISQWDGKPDHETINIEVKKTAVADEGEKISFHSISDLTELTSGAHYILAAESGGSYYALAYDGNTYVTPLLLQPTADGYTFEASEQDVKSGDFVLTASSAGTASENMASGVKFATNYKDANNEKIYLKLGESDSANYHTLFSTGGGNLSISRDGNQFYIKKGSVGKLSLQSNSSQEPYFTWKSGYSDIIILTDAKVASEQPQGNQTFYQVSPYELGVKDKPCLFVYKAGDNKYYALTSTGTGTGAVEVSLSTNADGYTSIVTDFSNAWMSTSRLYSSSGNPGGGYCSFYKSDGFRQSDKYLSLSASSMVSENAEGIRLVTNYSMGQWGTDNYFHFYDSYKPKISNDDSSLFIGWDESEESFVSTNDVNAAIQFELYAYQPGYTRETYYPVNDLSHIEDWSKILITCKDANDNDCILVPGTDSNGLELIPIANSPDNGVVYYGEDTRTLNAPTTYSLTLGKLTSSSAQKYKLLALRWSDLGEALYVDGFVKNSGFLASDDKECMLTYNSTGGIILRGAKQWLVYDAENNTFTTSDSEEAATPIQIWAVNEPKGEIVTVNFHDASNNLETTSQEAQGSLVLPGREDVEKDGVTYTFVGWSTEKATYLGLDESCDLYDFDDTTKTGSIKDSAKEEFNLIGHCNPEETDSIDLSNYEKNSQLDLYPVYAVKGYSAAVTAKETADGKETQIIGISDWKDLQGSDNSQLDREKWLGRIYVNVYKDGELWVNSAPMYFQYHNDDAADVNLKFISDELLKNYEMQKNETQNGETQNDPLYDYLSDPDAFPLTSQKGNYVIDAVYAEQGGSEDGLKYEYNWLTDHGGQLDNVEGGSTINVYVTSVYQVEYYLDDKLLEDSTWVDTHYYTTPGTDNEFGKQETNANYQVSMDNKYRDLMDPKSVDNTFMDDAIKRGDYSSFAYSIHNYNHTIPLAQLPDAPEGYVLTASTWAMKDEDGKLLATLAPQANYAVTGTTYETGTTKNAWLDNDDTFPTFHLYAYSKKPSGGGGTKPSTTTVSVSKVWDDGGSEKRPESISVQLYRDGTAYNSPVTLNDANGWQHTWTGLNTSYRWTVDELNVPEGYVSSASNQGNAWTITNALKDPPDEPDEPDNPPPDTPDTPDEPDLTDVPDSPVPTDALDFPTPTDTPTSKNTTNAPKTSDNVPQTGDNAHLSLWVTLALLSAAGLVVTLLSSKKDHKGKRDAK